MSTIKTPSPQIINKCYVRIMKRPNGDRFAQIDPGGHISLRYHVPVQLLSLAAGKDAWMRDIEFRCADCREKHPASKMECELCPACYEKAEAENAADNA